MISNIPRMGEVASIITNQERNYNGSGSSNDGIIGDKIPYGARLLKIVSDYDVLVQSGRDSASSCEVLKARANSGWYDSTILTEFCKTVVLSRKYKKKLITFEQLEENMILAEDIVSEDTKVIAGHKGQVVTKALRLTLLHFRQGKHTGDTLPVIIPVDE